jgi:hypothetical protein
MDLLRRGFSFMKIQDGTSIEAAPNALPEKGCYFLALPLEIRMKIYQYVLLNRPAFKRNADARRTPYLVLDAMTLERSGRKVVLHTEILRTCHACLEEASPILYSAVTLSLSMGREAASCLPTIRRLGTRNLALIRNFACEAQPHKLSLVWEQVAEIVDLMPELRTLFVMVWFHKMYEQDMWNLMCNGEARVANDRYAEEHSARLVRLLKPKLEGHQYMSRVVEQSIHGGFTRLYRFGGEEEASQDPSNKKVSVGHILPSVGPKILTKTP